MRLTPLAIVAIALVGAVACADDGGGASGADDAEVARSACAVLVSWTNDVADRINAVEADLAPGVVPRPLMLDALDDVIERTEALAGELDAVPYPSSDAGAALSAEMHDGQAAALEDLQGFRAEVAAIPDPDPERLNYRKAQMVVELEKPRSLVKPDIRGDLGDPALEHAILAEDSCRHVTRA